jgi:hypothetical protein
MQRPGMPPGANGPPLVRQQIPPGAQGRFDQRKQKFFFHLFVSQVYQYRRVQWQVCLVNIHLVIIRVNQVKG